MPNLCEVRMNEISNHSHENKCCHPSPRVVETLVSFKVSDKSYYLPVGYYTVRDIKLIAGVPESHILAEIKNDDVDTMSDETVTHICGGEVFKPFPGKGNAA
jgi:hypothetical protein